MALTVKPGREYVLGGKVYKAGEAVPEGQIASKYRALLISAKGPLSADGQPTSPTDLPKTAMPEADNGWVDGVYPMTPDVIETKTEEAAPEAPVDPRTDTRDITGTGPTGQVRQSRSSHPARQQKKRR